VFDKIVEGMKMASETIKLDDIKLEDTYPDNEKKMERTHYYQPHLHIP
jgi:hypothetical protein